MIHAFYLAVPYPGPVEIRVQSGITIQALSLCSIRTDEQFYLSFVNLFMLSKNTESRCENPTEFIIICLMLQNE